MKSKNNLAVLTQDAHTSVFELGGGYFIYKSAKLSQSKLGDLIGNWFSVHESKEAISVIAGKIVGFEYNEQRVNIVFKKVATISVAGKLLDWGHEKCYHDLKGRAEVKWHDEVDHGPSWTKLMWEQMIGRTLREVKEGGSILAITPSIHLRQGKSKTINDILNNITFKENNVSVLTIIDDTHFPMVSGKKFDMIITNPPYLTPLVEVTTNNKG